MAFSRRRWLKHVIRFCDLLTRIHPPVFELGFSKEMGGVLFTDVFTTGTRHQETSNSFH
ncbi:Uncharacterised protein [Legionella donaldsonii]|uniref:Uncharacterized protein n=1 Tax=Legionella donaldsonii TaxID=45060 RepID=A0A378J2J6_9GAMM|nr:Uncharacterised protein [Legionella donaldsonii]